MDYGYFPTLRKVVYKLRTKPHCLQLYIHLLSKAAYKPHEYNGIMLKIGQCVVGKKNLSKELDVSATSIWRRLAWLAKRSYFKKESGPLGTLITFSNYRCYKDGDPRRGLVDSNETAQLPVPNNKDKRINNNITDSTEGEQLVLASFNLSPLIKFQTFTKSFPSWSKEKCEYWYIKAKKWSEQYNDHPNLGKSENWVKLIEKWQKENPFESTNISSSQNSEALECANLLKELILKNHPHAVIPTNLNQWSKEIERFITYHGIVCCQMKSNF